MTNAVTLSASQLRQFTGSENWYRHGINRSVLYTDGAKFRERCLNPMSYVFGGACFCKESSRAV